MVKQVEYVVCPLCGMNHVLVSQKRGEHGKPVDYEWLNSNVITMDYVQTREGGGKTGSGKKGRGQGKGVGFHKISALTLPQCVSSNSYVVLTRQMVDQLIRIVKETKRLGLVSDADLK